MRIFEEYFKRHNINCPLVHHCQNAVAFFKTDYNIWKNNWLVINIKIDPNSLTQCTLYLIDFSFPDKEFLADNLTTIAREWNEYEDYFEEWLKTIKGVEFVIGQKEKELFSWEMFVYTQDYWFAKEFQYQNLLYNSLVGDIDTRHKYYLEIISYISVYFPNIHNLWKNEFFQKREPYADWFKPLMDKKI